MRQYVPYILPVLFTMVLVFHYVGTALSYLTPTPSALVEIGPQGSQMPPPSAADAAETALAPPETQPVSRPRAPRSQAAQRSATPTSRPTAPAIPDAKDEPADNGPTQTVVVGDRDGIRKYERPVPPSPAPPAANARPPVPTADQLDAMEFIIDASPGSIEELVRNVDGAFIRGGRLYDVHGNPVASTTRFTSGSRLIVFYAVDSGLSVVLPITVVDAVLERVALKSGTGAPRRVMARFDPSGTLREVDVL